MKMDKPGAWHVHAFGLLLCCCFLGCATFEPGPVPQNGKLDPFLDEIVRQEPLEKKLWSVTLKPDVVLRDIPLQTPVAEARAIMERHGFSCWSGVADAKGKCLHCTAYIRKSPDYADRVVVKLFYDTERVVNVAVTIEYKVRHSVRGFWSVLTSPYPQATANATTDLNKEMAPKKGSSGEIPNKAGQ
jgi:hypothetical protein